MWRNIASTFLTLLVVVLIGVAIVAAWGRNQYTGPGPSAVAQCVTVARGASLNALSQQMAEQGVISNAYVLRTGADYEGKADQLKFGSYMVPPNASMQQVIEAVTAGGPSTCGVEVVFRVGVRGNRVVMRDINPESGRYEDRLTYDPAADAVPVEVAQAVERPGARLRVAVAEGVTSWQVVEALKAADFMAGETGEVPPEGSLAPDTYEVERGADREALIAQMRASQAAILEAAWEARPFGLPYETPEEALIMASIVEKETGVPEERRMVASVFVNRLEDGMRLQTDPTVIYGVTEGRAVLDRGIRRSELVERTPYNTYVIDGLPPTPIANPGRAAIDAALNPDATEYLYFVADGTGGHAFARTLEEHNANVARWRRIEAERGQATDTPVQTDG
ncbi:endolytic transglycosylase MltG [Paracoccus sp. Z118]|uniref:endolytic transglycosylase MltG n=1 Tax=Paracoccus sp. Z118 TaxID=2851017 RepID=UPI001C2BCC27|nr:endolytic transglycosylase MltG [Paracoccus sp. Z118]MBV0891926.1 endolytic transglycosylase MltG [Paracoccus sp. Z118]